MSSGNNRTIGLTIAGLAFAATGVIFLIAGKAAVGISMLAVGVALIGVGMGVARQAAAADGTATPRPVAPDERPGARADR
jgi:hypothetical protein